MFVQIPGFPRYLVDEHGTVVSTVDGKWKILRVFTTPTGYCRVSLTDHKKFAVHRLVMRTFVGPLPLGYQINHINANKSDNRLVNLEYCTPKENTEHAFANNLRKPRSGEQHHTAKLSDIQIQEVRALQGTAPQSAIAKRYGISQTSVSQIWRGKTRVRQI